TAQGLVQALQLADGSMLSPDPLMRYKEAVADENADLTFRGLGLPTTEPRSMDDLYVPVRVVRKARERDHDCEPSMAQKEEKPLAEPDERTVAQCLARHRRVLLRGEPGSGKTTLLRHAARAYATGLSGEEGHPKP